MVLFLLKIGSPFGPFFEYFGSPSKLGTVVTRTANIAGWAREPSQTRAPALLRTHRFSSRHPHPPHPQADPYGYPYGYPYLLHTLSESSKKSAYMCNTLPEQNNEYLCLGLKSPFRSCRGNILIGKLFSFKSG